jgi:acyl carrier protein
MNRPEVEEALRRVLADIQTQSGRPVPDWTIRLRPIGDIDGFDSLNAEEAVVELEEALGVSLVENCFISDDGRRALRLNEVVDRLCAVCGIEEDG